MVQELDSQTLIFGGGDQFAFVGVAVEILTCIDQGEVLGSLDDQEDDVLDVEDERGGPVHNVVDVALRGRANNKMIMLHAHVDNPLSEVEIIIHFMKAIIDANLVLLIQGGLDMGPGELSVDNRSENDMTIATGTGDDCTVVAPGKAKDRAAFWLIKGVRPS